MPRVSRALAFSTLFALAPAVADANESYYRLIYDYEVASFCGLVRAPVHDAYSKKRERLEDQLGLAAETLTDIRVGAMADAEREYINRGLGGHKPWCRSDGRAGVRRILE